MAFLTRFKQLLGLEQGERFDINGYQFVNRDRVVIDSGLHHLETHRHNGATISSPAAPAVPAAVLNTALDGAFPGGTDVYYRVSKVSALGIESVASAAITVTTPESLGVPDEPTVAAIVSGGELLPGRYDYAITWYRGFLTFDTLGSIAATANLLTTNGSHQRIQLTFPDLPDGADGINIYRRVPGGVRFAYLASVAAADAGDPFIDDGTTVAAIDRVVPTNRDSSSAGNAITITPAGGAGPALAAGESFRIFRTYDPEDWAPSLIAEVAFGDPTTVNDLGAPAQNGSPLDTAITWENPPAIDLASDVTGLLPADRIDGSLGGGGTPYTYKLVGQWNRVLDGITGSSLTVLGYGADARPTNPPTTVPGDTFLFDVTSAYIDAPVLGAPPTKADIPAASNFSGFGSGNDSPFVGVVLPVADVSGFLPNGHAAWLKHVLTDGAGATATLTVYLVWNDDDTAGITVYLLVDDTVTSFAIPGAATTGEPGATVEHDVTLVFGSDISEMWRRRAHGDFVAQWNQADALAAVGGTTPVLAIACATAALVPPLASVVSNSFGMVLGAPLGHDPTYADLPTDDDAAWISTGEPFEGTSLTWLIPPSLFSFTLPDWVPGSAIWVRNVCVAPNGDRSVLYLYCAAVPEDDTSGNSTFFLLSGGAVTTFVVADPPATLEPGPETVARVLIDWEPREAPPLVPPTAVTAAEVIDGYYSGQTDPLERVSQSQSGAGTALPSNSAAAWIISPTADVTINAVTMNINTPGATGAKFRIGLYALVGGTSVGPALVDEEFPAESSSPVNPTNTFTGVPLVGGRGYLAIICSNDLTAAYGEPVAAPGISLGSNYNNSVKALLAGFTYGPYPDGGDLSYGANVTYSRPYVLWTIA